MSGKRKKRDTPSEVTLPITPMLDMAFQLLAFFIFTYNPSALEGQMDLALPMKSEKAAHDAKDMNQSAETHKEDDIDVPLDLNVRVHAQEVKYTMTLEEQGGAVRTPVDSLDGLKEQLKKVFKDKAETIGAKLKGLDTKERESTLRDELKKVAIKVQGDTKLPWKYVVEVMDACRMAGTKAFEEAGFDVKLQNVVNVSFAAPPDQGVGQ